MLRLRAHICARQQGDKPTFSVGAGTALVCGNNNGGEVVGVASYAGYWERVAGGAGPKVFTNLADEGFASEASSEWIDEIMSDYDEE